MPARLPPALDMIRQLVAQPSASSSDPLLDQSNMGVILLLSTWLEELGFRVEHMPVCTHPAKANLIATLGEGAGGLVLAGHTDTVPCDESRWTHGPYDAALVDDRLYGLGASDMKGFFGVVLQAVQGLGAGALKAPLTVVATADEESTMSGARALLGEGRPRARWAVVGEPTRLLPVRMHKGIIMAAIRLVGRSGHSSDPALGRSALEGMHEVMSSLLAFRRELQTAHRDPHFAVPYPTLNFGRIAGGDVPNRICGECELQVDLRCLPGMDSATLRDELRARVRAAVQGSDLEVRFRELEACIPSFVTPADAQLVLEVEAMAGERAGAVQYCTESPFYAQLGMETIVLGPGDIAVAHQPDEYFPMAQAEPAVRLLQKLIHRACVEPSTEGDR